MGHLLPWRFVQLCFVDLPLYKYCALNTGQVVIAINETNQRILKYNNVAQMFLICDIQ